MSTPSPLLFLLVSVELLIFYGLAAAKAVVATSARDYGNVGALASWASRLIIYLDAGHKFRFSASGYFKKSGLVETLEKY